MHDRVYRVGEMIETFRLIAGIYGMNVEGLPPARHPLGTGLGLGLPAYFRTRRRI